MKFYRTYVFKFKTSTGIKYYAGKHTSTFENPVEDDYTGSGKIIRRAFKKYGYDMYISREWQNHETEELMKEFEELLVDECKEAYGKCCTNIAKGGNGGNMLQYASEECKAEYSAKMSIVKRGTKHSDDAREKISRVRIGTKHSDETREKISISMKNMSIETRIKMSKAKQNMPAEIRTKILKAKRSSAIWQNELYHIIWNEWNTNFDKNGNHLKHGRFSAHLTKSGIHECLPSEIKALILHFNRVLNGEEQPFNKI